MTREELKESIEGIISHGERGNAPLSEQAEAILKLFDRFLEFRLRLEMNELPEFTPNIVIDDFHLETEDDD